MLKSMTSFARVTTPAAKNGGWIMEVRSINHRFFDFSLKLPPDLFVLENRIRELVHAKMHRGKVTVSISQDSGEDALDVLTLDLAVAKRYQKAMDKLKRQFKVAGDVSLGDLMRLPQLLTTQKTKKSAEKLWPTLRTALKQVLERALKAKSLEGRKIEKDVRGRLIQISKAVQRIDKDAVDRSQDYFDRIKTRIEKLLAEEVRDNDRLWREAALLAEKSDITEEIVRLKSHLSLFEDRVTDRKANKEVGRELDFICQEMHREINTLGSKAQFFDIAREVVSVKGEIEKIREQIQNVE